MKVELIRRKPHWMDKPGDHVEITRSLPFFQNAPHRYVHRVRSATLYYHKGVFSHLGVGFWCGGAGFYEPGDTVYRHRRRREGQFLVEPPDRALNCATCEGRAIGAGQLGSRVLCGKLLVFNPRV